MKQRVLALAAAGIVMVISSTHLFAQRLPQTQEVLKILGISVEGNSLAEPSAIIANSGLRVGDEFTLPGDKIGQSVRKLWQLKIFSDVQIVIDRRVGEGVFLAIRVTELPRYEETVISGSDEISTDKLEKKMALVRGQVIAPHDLTRIQKDILKMYEEEGHMLADVKVSTQQLDTSKNRVNLLVDIDEGPYVKVRNIYFSGNEAFDSGDLKGAMKEIAEARWWKIFSSHKFDRKKYEDDKKLIVKFYQKNGYRDASVIGDSIWYSEDKKNMNIRIDVHEGAQYKIRNIAWEGNTVYSDEILNEQLGMKPGDVYNQEKFEQNLRGNESQTDVASLYLNNGYLAFNLEPEETRVAEDSVDIRIKVYERNKFVIGRVDIKGNTKTHDKVIRRELYSRPGDFFNRAAIIRSIRQLSVLNYFNPEKINPDTYIHPEDNIVDLTYSVEEKSSDNINASIGYSGAFGVTGALGFTINNFSIAEPLSGGAGQILNFEWQFGTESQYRTFTVGFTEPWLFDSPTTFGVSLYSTKIRYTYNSERTGGSLRIGRRFRWPDDYFRGDWILTGQRVAEDYPLIDVGLSKYTQVSITQIISRNSIDNPVFPTYGSNFSLSIQMSGGPLLPGNVDFHKWILNSEWYVPLFNSSRVALYLSSEFGYVGEFGQSAGLPFNDRFYMGGTGLGYISTTALRGYEDQSIGPRDQLGRIFGGRAMTRQTAELRLALAINPIPIYILGFVEGGNVWERWQKADFANLKRSAGFGARLQINPIGLIGFDYGFGFDDVLPLDGQPDGWKFHFVFGRGF
ncbi:MAG: outer membrane protein assembly factor BamA [Bacteroidetes bacterium]|nr:outer membrane protein assembly factor BamA [Bacteroidota bacterium]MCW5896550.1 outer membrane protein assembly factor BamA [Bacteroidota bacterium]